MAPQFWLNGQLALACTRHHTTRKSVGNWRASSLWRAESLAVAKVPAR